MNTLSSTFGALARQLIRRLVRLYYSAIEIDGQDRVPATGPVLLVANHANSLIDPVVLGTAARRPVHFLAKAPLFKTPVLGPAMHALGMVPAFRGSDDRSQVQRNVESLTAAASYLAKGEVVGLFPEGKSHDDLHVEQVRSGAARIALQAVELGAKNLKIVPLGINYERKEQFRSAAWVAIGEPIELEAWRATHPGEERQQMRALTAEIDQRLKALVVHLEQPEWQPQLRDIERLFPPAPGLWPRSTAVVRHRKQIAEAMNHFFQTDPARAGKIAASLKAHQERLAALDLDTGSEVLQLGAWRYRLHATWRAVKFLLGLAPALIGTVHHLVPFLIVRGLAPRFQAPGKTTIALMRLGFGFPIYAAWYALVGWRLSLVFGAALAWAWSACLPVAGIFALDYWRRAVEAIRRVWPQLRLLNHASELKALRREHHALRATLELLAEEHHRVGPADPTRASLR